MIHGVRKVLLKVNLIHGVIKWHLLLMGILIHGVRNWWLLLMVILMHGVRKQYLQLLEYGTLVLLRRKVPVTMCGVVNQLGLVDLMLLAALGMERQSIRRVKRVTTGERLAGWWTWVLELMQTLGEARLKQ